MQCEHCRGTGLDSATTPAMNVKCQHCVGGKVELIGLDLTKEDTFVKPIESNEKFIGTINYPKVQKKGN